MGILINPPWHAENFKIEELIEKLIISEQLMIDGIVFIWVEKQYIYDIVMSFEKQNLNYNK